jgi:DtxR family Mn-dependent transcriptional regulator
MIGDEKSGGEEGRSLTPAMEDYLEAIYCIGQGKKVVRVKNIASRIGVTMPTVTSMLKSLNQKGFVDYEKREYLELTPEGERVGREINRRHQVLLSFLIEILGVDPEVADGEACRIEHGIGARTMDRLVRFINFIETCPRTGPDWIKAFAECRDSPGYGCSVHLKDCIEEMERKRKRLDAGKDGEDDAQ